MNNRYFGAVGSKGCKFNCIYCFTQEDTYQRLPRLDKLNQEELTSELCGYDVIQPSCDTDLFLLKDWHSYLERFSKLGKSVSFATKATVDNSDIAILKELDKNLRDTTNILHIGLSILKLQDWDELEPFAPSPVERVTTLKKLYESGISTSVLIRPLLPNLSLPEIDEIISLTHRYCDSYVVGPLYLSTKTKSYFKSIGVDYQSFNKVVEWQVNKPQLEAYYDEEKEKYIQQAAQRFNLPVFNSNSDAVHFSKCKRISMI